MAIHYRLLWGETRKEERMATCIAAAITPATNLFARPFIYILPSFLTSMTMLPSQHEARAILEGQTFLL